MEGAGSHAVADADNLKATELRLGLPGTAEPSSPPPTPRGSKRALSDEGASPEGAEEGEEAAAPTAAKAQVVGWPPVRAYRRSCFQGAARGKNTAQEEAKANPGGLYVKVSMDGAPYLRKIDLKNYKGYRELREGLEAMFLCFSGLDGSNSCSNSNNSNSNSNSSTNPSEFAITYEDKDGDLMLVGDVPWGMFTSSCKRLRIMKGSEARGLGSSRP